MTRDPTRPEAHWDGWPDVDEHGDKRLAPVVVRVTDLDEGPDDSLSQFISDFTAVNGELYFRADDGGGPVPWKVARDGEVVQAADITFPETLTEFQGELYFYSADSFFRPDVCDGGYGLWKLDRNDDVVFVADVDEGIAEDFPDDLNDKFTVFNGELYIWANLENSGIEPWKVTSDGDLVPVADIDEGPDGSFPREFTEFEDELYFWALDSSGLNDDLWKVARDGDVVRVAESEGGGGSRFSVPSNFGELGGELYFQLDEGERGAEPWKLANDGEPVQVADINAGSASSSPDEFIEFDGELYFRADDGETGVELWKATPDGEVVRVADIDEGPDSSSPGGFTKFDGELYFRADDGESGVELWKVGRDGEVSRVTDINDGPATAFGPFLSDFTPLPYDLVPLNDELFFQADDGESGVELWKLDRDGQAVQAADIDPGPDSSFPLALTEFEGEIYFHADDGTTGRELWKVTEGGVKRDRDDQKPPYDDGFADAEGHDEADGEQSRYDDGHEGYLPVHVEAGYAPGRGRLRRLGSGRLRRRPDAAARTGSGRTLGQADTGTATASPEACATRGSSIEVTAQWPAGTSRLGLCLGGRSTRGGSRLGGRERRLQVRFASFVTGVRAPARPRRKVPRERSSLHDGGSGLSFPALGSIERARSSVPARRSGGAPEQPKPAFNGGRRRPFSFGDAGGRSRAAVVHRRHPRLQLREPTQPCSAP